MKALPWILISLFAIVAFTTVFLAVRLSIPKTKEEQPVVPPEKVELVLRDGRWEKNEALPRR